MKDEKLTDEEIQEILSRNPNVKDYLKSEQGILESKRAKLTQYDAQLTEYEQSKKKFKLYGMLKYFPEKGLIRDATLILALIAGLIYFTPALVETLLSQYMTDASALEQLFIIQSVVVVGEAILLLFIFLVAGKWVIPAAECFRKNYPMIGIFDKHGRAKFVCPQKSTMDILKIKGYGSAVPDPEQFLPTNNRLQISFLIPEKGITFNPRNILKGIMPHPDMATIEEYYETGGRDALSGIKRSFDWIGALAPIIIILGLLYMLFGADMHSYLNNLNKEEALKAEIYQCKLTLANNGINPAEVITPTTIPPKKEVTTGTIPNFPSIGLT